MNHIDALARDHHRELRRLEVSKRIWTIGAIYEEGLGWTGLFR